MFSVFLSSYGNTRESLGEPQQKPLFPDLGAKIEPNKGGKKRNRRPKHRPSESSDSQGAAGPSTSRPNSEAGT